MNQLIASGSSCTMTSVELVAIINELRELGRAELAHFTFLTKIEKVLGVDAKKFLGVYLGANGQERPCYHLPKRECQLMVMSESYSVQARVYDRMVELESRTPVRIEFSRMELLELAMQSSALRLAIANPSSDPRLAH